LIIKTFGEGELSIKRGGRKKDLKGVVWYLEGAFLCGIGEEESGALPGDDR